MDSDWGGKYLDSNKSASAVTARTVACDATTYLPKHLLVVGELNHKRHLPHARFVSEGERTYACSGARALKAS